MDCHFKKGDVILLTDEEAVNKVSDPNCIIEEGVIFRFHYQEITTEPISTPVTNTQVIKPIPQVKIVKPISQIKVTKNATTSKETKKMADTPQVDVTEQQLSTEEVVPQPTTAVTTPADVPFDVNQVLATTGGGGGVAIILTIIAILGGGAAWKFYQSYSEQKHEQEMKKLELEAQKAGLNGAQPPPCQAANAAIEARLAVIEEKLSSVERKSSSLSANFDADDIEDRIIKLEKKVKTLSSKTT